MTDEQKRLVQDTFALVAPHAEQVATIFYDRLFEQFPQVRPMFKSDIKEQGRKLMNTLAVAVKGVDDPEKIRPALESLGRRHGDYGVVPEHYNAVGEVLLWTLAQGLGEAFTAEVEAAWTALYGWVAQTMIEAAETVAA